MEALRCWSEPASWGTSSCRRPRRLRLRRWNRRRRARPEGRGLRGIWPFRGTVPYRTVLQELNYYLTSHPPGSHLDRGAPELNEKGTAASNIFNLANGVGHFTCRYASLTRRFLPSFRVVRDPAAIRTGTSTTWLHRWAMYSRMSSGPSWSVEQWKYCANYTPMSSEHGCERLSHDQPIVFSRP